jgi:hypothetical protein
MSYNITTWKTKTLQDFTIPLAAVHALPDVRVELLPNGEVKATGLAEGFELGGTWDSISLLRVTSLKLLGDGSGFVWEYLLTALKQSKGSLVAVQIWESGAWQVGNRQPAAGEMAKKHKVAGLYFAEDCKKKGKYHLLPGLSGLRDFIGLALQNPANFEHLHVGVVWKYAGRSACSTNIDIGCGDAEAPGVVCYSAQDWDVDLPEYLPWCQAMADLLQKPFPYGEGESHKAGVFLPSSEEAPCPAK